VINKSFYNHLLITQGLFFWLILFNQYIYTDMKSIHAGVIWVFTLLSELPICLHLFIKQNPGSLCFVVLCSLMLTFEIFYKTIFLSLNHLFFDILYILL